jgi:DUF1680 family protein
MNCGVPFTTKTRLQGHAVRAMYACCGATDYYIETGDAAYRKTLETLWQDLAQAQMYITGGVGARSQGEAFGDDYELPNAQAYGESCAAIGNAMWNWRMLAATGEARFADVMERALYNGINSGMSLEGTLYEIRWHSIQRVARRFGTRGTTRRAARRISSGRLRACRATSIQRQKTACTCTCTTTRGCNGRSKAVTGSW